MIQRKKGKRNQGISVEKREIKESGPSIAHAFEGNKAKQNKTKPQRKQKNVSRKKQSKEKESGFGSQKSATFESSRVKRQSLTPLFQFPNEGTSWENIFLKMARHNGSETFGEACFYGDCLTSYIEDCARNMRVNQRNKKMVVDYQTQNGALQK